MTAIANTRPGFFEYIYLCLAAFMGYTVAKPKGPVTQKHQSVEVATPTYKRGFVTPKIQAVRRFAHSLMVTGRGGVYPQGLPHGCGRVFDHHAPPDALKNANGGFLSPAGTKTMTAITQRTIAPTSPQATTAQEAIAAHIGVHNCLSMAAWHIAKGNTPAAARKVRQALAALRQLDKLEG